MEFAFEEKTVSHLQLLAEEWLRQEETAELIVPDSEPDAAEVLDCFASCVVRSKECQAGSVLISGGIQGGVLPGMLEMANGHFFRGIWKMISG